MSVNLASRMVSAISFGVLRRLAPSTIAIMRSRKLSPGLLAMRTMIQSDSTRVPPVTALRSPPDSRMTGADSPVIALSSTVAAPSMTSPSPGMNSPASTRTRSPLRRSCAACDVDLASRCVAASESCARPHRAAHCAAMSACALPRPSAIASAKFANSSVNHSQSATARMKPAGASPWPPSACSHSSGRQDAADEHDEHHRVAELRARESLRNASRIARQQQLRIERARSYEVECVVMCMCFE